MNISSSVVKSIEEEKRWWENENRYSMVKLAQGILKIENSTVRNIGWSDSEAERGIEILGEEFELTNSTIKDGRNGLIFDDCETVLDDIVDKLIITDMEKNSIMVLGTSSVWITDSTLKNSRGVSVLKDGIGNLTLANSTFEEFDVSGDGDLNIQYPQDFTIKDQNGRVSNKVVTIFDKTESWSDNYTTDSQGRINDIDLLWRVVNSTNSSKKTYGIKYENNKTYFSPSNYNRLNINYSQEGQLYLTDVSVEPNSYVPVNNSLEPNNITVTVNGINNLAVDYHENITFYWNRIYLKKFDLNVSAGSNFTFCFDWVPDVKGYGKIQAVLDVKSSMSKDNLVSWSETFFVGYYNETIITYDNFTKRSVRMMEYGVQYEDGDEHYTIYENWLPDVLMECGLSYFGAYEVTGNYSYYERGRKQFHYALNFRDQWGLYNRSTFYEVRRRFEDTYHEWSTHRNVRAALALQQAYLYTGNETYKNVSDNMIDFVLNKAARENISYHNGTEYSVFWESTESNDGDGGVKGMSKNFTFLFVNGYVQLGRLLTQAYFDENINSSYYHDDRLIPHINTCIEYLINDQIDSGDSIGTWAYFSYYDEPDPWRRRSMNYAALTAKELARTNTYLQWKNISEAISNYTSYVEKRLTLRSAIDVHNGGYANIMIYNHWRSIYRTTNRNVSKIEDFMFSNIFFNQNGTTNSFTLSTDREMIDPKDYGFLYIHYNPLRTILWDRYYENRTEDLTINLEFHNGNHGWNFISSRLVPSSTDLLEILNHEDRGISGNYDKVMWYDSAEESWRSYMPERYSHFDDIYEWDHSMGLWIRMSKDDNLTVEGIAPYRTRITLQSGWNTVGYPTNLTEKASVSLPSEVTKLGVFNASRQNYVEYIYDLKNYTLKPNEGYFVYNSGENEVDWVIDYRD
ncbi:MAG: hypothetical protein ACOC1V_05435 [Candidatus Saliniplasma sp.]